MVNPSLQVIFRAGGCFPTCLRVSPPAFFLPIAFAVAVVEVMLFLSFEFSLVSRGMERFSFFFVVLYEFFTGLSEECFFFVFDCSLDLSWLMRRCDALRTW